MDVTIFNIGPDAYAARVTTFMDGDLKYYDFGDGNPDLSGTVLAKPSRLGMHPRHGVMLSFGGDSGGIVDLGDWGVKGSVVCSGDDMLPGPPPYGAQYPINQVRKDDPDTADWLSDLATAIATHYADSYTGRGLR